MTTSQAEEYSAIRRVLERGARPPRGQAVPRWPGRLIQVIAVTAALVVAGSFLQELLWAALAAATACALAAD
jgi:hypothetical protein